MPPRTQSGRESHAAKSRLNTPIAVLEGKYALLRELGAGAAGTVYEAEHLVVGKRVAIKVLHSHLAGDDHLRARFIEEARAAAQIGHENVVDIYDYGVTAEGQAYLVMQLLVGETLEELNLRRGVVPPATACEIMVQVLAALGAAHRYGIVHRDLKPSNVIVTYPRPDTPLVKVLNFGIAQRSPDGPVGKEGLLGTPMYMSPEQALGRRVEASADVYAAGVILYEMLAGEPPFTGNVMDVLGKVVSGKWRPLLRINPAVPRQLVAAVNQAIATDPSERLQTAGELGAQLLPFLSRPPPHSIPGGPTSADAFPLLAGTQAEGTFSDFPASRPPRDFPSLGLVHVAGKPRGEPLADAILQSPIIPRAPVAPNIQLLDGTRDVERWSNAPSPSRETRHTLDEPVPPSQDTSDFDAVLHTRSEGPRFEGNRSEPSEGPSSSASLRWAVQATLVGVGLGAALAWFFRMS